MPELDGFDGSIYEARGFRSKCFRRVFFRGPILFGVVWEFRLRVEEECTHFGWG